MLGSPRPTVSELVILLPVASEQQLWKFPL